MDPYYRNQIIFLVIQLAVVALFLLTPRALLRQVDEKRRTMQPELVWLNLIPVFDYVWILVTLIKIRSSVRAECLARRQPDLGNGSAFGVGLASWLLYLVRTPAAVLVVLERGEHHTLTLFGLAYLVFICLWIAYWVKLSNLKNDLMVDPGIVGAIASYQAAGDKCSSCGAAVNEDDDYCRLCGAATDAKTGPAAPAATGTSVVAAPAEPASSEAAVPGGNPGSAGTIGAICPFCATPYRPNAQFCSSCGRPAV